MTQHVREVVFEVIHEQRLELVTPAGKGNSKSQGPGGRNLVFGLHERTLPHVLSLTFSLRVPAPSSPRGPGPLLEKLPGLKGRPSGHFQGAMN